jgi:glycerol-3-phosphate acyltransferase PlsY
VLIPILVTLFVGYLLGSLPFGYLVARAKGVNIFEVGSKNPGATNVRRVLGHGPGNLVLLLDAAKGAAATFAPYGWRLAGGGSADGIDAAQFGYLAIAGLVSSMLGHSFSCFTGFRGGKGVATGIGGFIVLFPPGAGIALALFVLTLAVTRYVSLGSMLGAVSLPVSAWLLGRSPVLIGMSVAVALFVVIRHRSNISRLLHGTELKVGQKREGTDPDS